jgi:hypothetical protein
MRDAAARLYILELADPGRFRGDLPTAEFRGYRPTAEFRGDLPTAERGLLANRRVVVGAVVN